VVAEGPYAELVKHPKKFPRSHTVKELTEDRFRG
jgi:hypothetical protein